MDFLKIILFLIYFTYNLYLCEKQSPSPPKGLLRYRRARAVYYTHFQLHYI